MCSRPGTCSRSQGPLGYRGEPGSHGEKGDEVRRPTGDGRDDSRAREILSSDDVTDQAASLSVVPSTAAGGQHGAA